MRVATLKPTLSVPLFPLPKDLRALETRVKTARIRPIALEPEWNAVSPILIVFSPFFQPLSNSRLSLINQDKASLSVGLDGLESLCKNSLLRRWVLHLKIKTNLCQLYLYVIFTSIHSALYLHVAIKCKYYLKYDLHATSFPRFYDNN